MMQDEINNDTSFWKGISPQLNEIFSTLLSNAALLSLQ